MREPRWTVMGARLALLERRSRAGNSLMNPAASQSLPAAVWDHAFKMRRLLIALAVIALVAIVVLGLTQTGGQKQTSKRLTLAQMRQSLQGAPPALADVYRRANTVVGGSTKAF